MKTKLPRNAHWRPSSQTRASLLLCATLVGAALPAKPIAAETATPASLFVASVGVTIHLSYTDTLYNNFPLVLSSLSALGIHHVRDGLVAPPASQYCAYYRGLAAHGIRTDLVTSESQSLETLKAAVNAMSPAVEYVESPNEFDQAGPSWPQRLLPFLRRLSALLKTEPAGARIPVLGPSLTKAESYPRLGDVSAYTQFGNLHNYFGGHNPGTGGWGDHGYGSIAWNLENVAITNPGQPVITTETGYTNQVSSPSSVPESIAARYLSRLLLEQWLHGIHRTYLYELLSSGGEDFGLLRADGTAKPAYHAVSGLLGLLNDPGDGPKAAALKYTIAGAAPDLHHLLFAKQDGTFYLALWIEASGYDVNAKVEIQVPTQQVLITLHKDVRQITAITFNDTGVMSSRPVPAGRSFTQVVGDRLTVLRITPAPASPD
jgi:hypothetical protein